MCRLEGIFYLILADILSCSAMDKRPVDAASQTLRNVYTKSLFDSLRRPCDKRLINCRRIGGRQRD